MSKMKKGSIRCKFDSHKWDVSEDGMERICERCGISYYEYYERQKKQYWFRFLAFLRPKLEYLKKKLLDPPRRYTESGKIDYLYHPTDWERRKVIVLRLFLWSLSLFGALTFVLYIKVKIVCLIGDLGISLEQISTIINERVK